MPPMTISQAALDELWDFSDPAGTENRMTAKAASASGSDRAELRTQAARALGLQERYAEADAVLDAIDDGDPAVRVRVALERGRVRNSSGSPDAAVPLFREAADAAASAGLVFLQVDALHMLAIADPARAEEHTAAAFAALATTEDARTLRWKVALHNNAGWSHLDAGRVPQAIAEFEASRDAAARWGTPQQVQWAEEAIAEARSAG